MKDWITALLVAAPAVAVLFLTRSPRLMIMFLLASVALYSAYAFRDGFVPMGELKHQPMPVKQPVIIRAHTDIVWDEHGLSGYEPLDEQHRRWVWSDLDGIHLDYGDDPVSDPLLVLEVVVRGEEEPHHLGFGRKQDPHQIIVEINQVWHDRNLL